MKHNFYYVLVDDGGKWSDDDYENLPYIRLETSSPKVNRSVVKEVAEYYYHNNYNNNWPLTFRIWDADSDIHHDYVVDMDLEPHFYISGKDPVR